MTLKSDSWKEIDQLLDLALAEDIGSGDATTDSIVPEDETCEAHFVARESGVLAGLEVVKHFYQRMCPDLTLTATQKDGSMFSPGDRLATVSGSARAIITGERVALNILQRMCGVATLTHRYVTAIEGTTAKVYDTRKTLPGWRALDKLAVFLGGGENHRRGLYDMILIKDNHIEMAARQDKDASATWAVRQAKAKSTLQIQIEVDTLDQLREILPEEPDMILLDNM
ncbi:MAG: carboxylating nicotinate-nucleotide diphosphorylase, partial [Planctomycetota bacterium]